MSPQQQWQHEVHRQDSQTGPEQKKTKCNENTIRLRWQVVKVHKRANYLINLQALLGLGWHICRTPTISAKKTKILHKSPMSAWSTRSSWRHPWCCPQWALASSQITQLSAVQNKKPGSPENWGFWGAWPVLGTARGFDPWDFLQQ